MTQSSDKKSARKFWWIIMLLPIGLAVGSVTSMIHHLKQNDVNESQDEFNVAVTLNTKDLQSAMGHALLFGKRNLTTSIGRINAQAVQRSIQGFVSPGGTGLQFIEEQVLSSAGSNIKRAYTEIQGSNKNNIVAVVIETVGEKSASDAAKLGIAPSVIRSLSEAKPLNSIRFVLTPETLPATEHAQSLLTTLDTSKQKLLKVIVLKEQDQLSISDIDGWKSNQGNISAAQLLDSENFVEITHPVLLKKQIEGIAPAFTQDTLKAADQLRSLILRTAN